MIPDIEEINKLTTRQYKLTVRTYKTKLRERVISSIKSSARIAKRSTVVQLEEPSMLKLKDKVEIRDSIVEDLIEAGYDARGDYYAITVRWGRKIK